jgi:hypothetical protein
VRFRITDGVGWTTTVPYHLLGPDDDQRGAERRDDRGRHDR